MIRMKNIKRSGDFDRNDVRSISAYPEILLP